ncbi:hypothetical protein EYF80_066032 [Liparis tanakae]|uniref:Uncharacterized protein n=1 Tax=Liparis tanakae TaxID=230148 RepID=A0A4Z2E4V1_9TELE|nr:hypothetical protein EYF80_066032 [Liparis tanakae]
MITMHNAVVFLNPSVVCFPDRSSVLDEARPDGQEAPRRPGRQHRQVPLRRLREPDAEHPLAEERQRVQGRAEDGRHQGERRRGDEETRVPF